MILGIGKDFIAGLEADLGSGALRLSRDLEGLRRHPQVVFLSVAVTVPINCQP